MGRPKWYPDEKTIRWVTQIAERAARDARSLARNDGSRGLYTGAAHQDARASAFEDLVLEIAKRSEPRAELPELEGCAS